MAEERARRIREESEFIIEQQVKQAEEDLRREVAAAAVALAEKIVRNQLGASDQQRLIDSFVGDIASANGARPAAPHSGSASPAGNGAPRSEI
jgi:F0F1-type ATP synthase membrane subunit b/b'